jgi:hypothetical protein
MQPIGFHTNTILSLQFVFPSSTATPFTGMGAPINTGVVNPAPSEAHVLSPHGAEAAAGPSLSSTLQTGLSLKGLGTAAPKAIGLGEDPPVTVTGVTPMHSRTRLLSIAADGKMAVFDVFTGACRACA